MERASEIWHAKATLTKSYTNCDGVTSWVPGRPSETGAGPGWAVDGVAVAVAAGSGPGWAGACGCMWVYVLYFYTAACSPKGYGSGPEACGCAESDSAARRARRRADSRIVTFSMAMAARSVVGEKQVLGGAQDVACRASDGGEAPTIYTWSVCAPRTTATHTRLPTRANPPTARTQPSTVTNRRHGHCFFKMGGGAAALL